MSDPISSLDEGERLVAAGQVEDGLRMLAAASERIHGGMPYAELFERVRQAGRLAREAESGRYADEADTLIGLTERQEHSVERFAAARGPGDATAALVRHVAPPRPSAASVAQTVAAYLGEAVPAPTRLITQPEASSMATTTQPVAPPETPAPAHDVAPPEAPPTATPARDGTPSVAPARSTARAPWYYGMATVVAVMAIIGGVLSVAGGVILAVQRSRYRTLDELGRITTAHHAVVLAYWIAIGIFAGVAWLALAVHMKLMRDIARSKTPAP